MTSRASTRNGGVKRAGVSPRGKGAAGKERLGGRSAPRGAQADLELVERFKQGDRAAFDLIFEAYSGPLLGFLTRMCGDPEDAREGLQDTLFSVFRNLDGFRGEASLKNWIFRIAVTTCLKKKRARRGLPCVTTEGGALERAGAGDPAHPLGGSQGSPEWRLDPETLVMDREFRRNMVQAVASMPYMYNVVINLRDFEGFSTQEVARILGLKEPTVKVRLHRARLYLQDWLRSHYRARGYGTPEGV
jgi:RNA polymerase sigma-70 factor, ECF subfamily